MAIRLHRIISVNKVPNGYFSIYFQELLGLSEEEFEYSHPTGGLTIPCNEDMFLQVTSRLN
ncbi:hypothetical protein ES332_D13G115400v1 [Gossypium tomentosum]|uniref:Uncharacterized protein n=1 Tax=Gossypium tomentosum TaxID=34277 RepID=A0A5D2HXG6_GOSTO|nr:hypothetical protein ES332_D13G115400v1 [Gossypium tomentosum]